MKSEVNYFGGINGDESIYRTKLGRINISFISFNQFQGDSPEKVAKKISKENEDERMVIVYAHWGEEYGPVTDFQKNTAKLFAKSGAKTIIGSHPHIISPSEKIGDTIVYYSLGNFVFDQYWNPEVRTGLMLELDIKNGQVTTKEHTVVLDRDGRTCLSTN
jgi:poly-gamma-glutamate synthesis protein (capsule biosynthesis protein)